MICNQLMEATNVLVKLSPQPSMWDITRAVCGCCDRVESCPSLSVEQAETIRKEDRKAKKLMKEK